MTLSLSVTVIVTDSGPTCVTYDPFAVNVPSLYVADVVVGVVGSEEGGVVPVSTGVVGSDGGGVVVFAGVAGSGDAPAHP